MAKPSQPGASATEEEPSFPRGGASSITPLKRRQIRAEAQAEAEKDFFAGVSAGDPANSKRRKKSGKQAPAQVQALPLAVFPVRFVSSCIGVKDFTESCTVVSTLR